MRSCQVKSCQSKGRSGYVRSGKDNSGQVRSRAGQIRIELFSSREIRKVR